MARGEFITDAAAEAGTYRRKGAGWLAAAGGVRPRRGRDLKRRCLTLTEREEIAMGRARGDSVRKVAELTGRGAPRWSEWSRRGPGQARSPPAAPTSNTDPSGLDRDEVGPRPPQPANGCLVCDNCRAAIAASLMNSPAAMAAQNT